MPCKYFWTYKTLFYLKCTEHLRWVRQKVVCFTWIISVNFLVSTFPSNIIVNMLFKLFVLSLLTKRNAYIMGHQGTSKLETKILSGNLGSLCNRNNTQRKSYYEGGGISFLPHADILDFLKGTPLSDRSDHVTIGSLKQFKPQPLRT